MNTTQKVLLLGGLVALGFYALTKTRRQRPVQPPQGAWV